MPLTYYELYCDDGYCDIDYVQNFNTFDVYYIYDYALTGYVMDYDSVDMSLNTVPYSVTVNNIDIAVDFGIWQPIIPLPDNIWTNI